MRGTSNLHLPLRPPIARKNFSKTKKDPDEGLAPLQGVDVSISEEDITPEEGFNRIENVQVHETGGILGVRGIVYEPINESGVILLFAALCHDLGFMIEGIRSSFPDALLRRRNAKGTWNSCRAEFEFKSSSFRLHKHDPRRCDLIYNGPQNLDSEISYTWEIKGGGPSGTNAKEVSAFI